MTTVRTNRRLLALAAALALATVLLAACGDDDEAGTATSTTAVPADSGGDAGDGTATVAVEGAWARTSPAMASAGAAYLQLTSATGDRLLSARVDPSIAGTVELHETVMADGETADGEMAGEMSMRPVDGVDLPAGEAVALEPGGLHVMLLDLAAPLETGQVFDLTLTFEQAGEQVVSVEVRDEAP